MRNFYLCNKTVNVRKGAGEEPADVTYSYYNILHIAVKDGSAPPPPPPRNVLSVLRASSACTAGRIWHRLPAICIVDHLLVPVTRLLFSSRHFIPEAPGLQENIVVSLQVVHRAESWSPLEATPLWRPHSTVEHSHTGGVATQCRLSAYCTYTWDFSIYSLRDYNTHTLLHIHPGSHPSLHTLRAI